MPISNEEWNVRLKAAAERATKRDIPLGDGIYDAIYEFGAALMAMTNEAASMRAEVKAEKRRERYAERKKLGLIKTAAQRKAEKEAKRKAEAEERNYQDEYPIESCYCHSLRYPPCSWCTREINEEEEG